MRAHLESVGLLCCRIDLNIPYTPSLYSYNSFSFNNRKKCVIQLYGHAENGLQANCIDNMTCLGTMLNSIGSVHCRISLYFGPGESRVQTIDGFCSVRIQKNSLLYPSMSNDLFISHLHFDFKTTNILDLFRSSINLNNKTVSNIGYLH